jgi:hypothetical protein
MEFVILGGVFGSVLVILFGSLITRSFVLRSRNKPQISKYEAAKENWVTSGDLEDLDRMVKELED